MSVKSKYIHSVDTLIKSLEKARIPGISLGVDGVGRALKEYFLKGGAPLRHFDQIT